MEPVKAPQAELVAERRRQVVGEGVEEGLTSFVGLGGAEFTSLTELTVASDAITFDNGVTMVLT